MSTTRSAYSSALDLGLSQVPQVDDPNLYRALLDIHNAIEILATSVGGEDDSLLEFITRYQNVVSISATYTLNGTEGVVLVSAVDGNVVLTLPPIATIIGRRYVIKRTDSTLTNTVTLIGNGLELIDSRVGGIKVSSKSSYTVVATSTGWSII